MQKKSFSPSGPNDDQDYLAWIDLFIGLIKHIQNKSFCLHNICVCTVYIYYVYMHTLTYSIYFGNIYMHIYI